MTSIFILAALLQDPADAIAAAQKRAASENRRVLVVWGATDALSTMLKKDRDVSRKILYEYDVVHADAKREEAAKKLGADVSKLPWLTILAADGKALANAESPAEPKALVELLAKHQAEPWKAKEVLDAAMKRAKEEKKRVLLTFGAPW
jgi:hypothetical protein